MKIARYPSTSSVLLAISIASVSLYDTTAVALAQSSADPELAFNGHCRQCHSFAKNDNRVGPSLYGVVGRKAGTVPGYSYSESLKGSGITWNEKILDQWIANPNKVVPGNKMGALFSGLPDASIRAKIITFLKSDKSAK